MSVQENLHRLWAGVAPGWERHAGYVAQRAAPITERMIGLAAPKPGERVLELSCASGDTGLAALPLVLPGGDVVLSDVCEEMTAIAERRIAAEGAHGVRVRVLDLEEIAEPDASFDVVLCRDGLQFAVDPGRGAAEIRRIMRRHGRVALATWAAGERNPWLGIVFDSVAAELRRPIPPPGMPSPFSLADPDRLAALLRAAGLQDVAVEELAAPLYPPSFDAWWTTTTSLAGPLAVIVAALDAPVATAIRERAAKAAAAYATAAGGLAFPGTALIASGRAG